MPKRKYSAPKNIIGQQVKQMGQFRSVSKARDELKAKKEAEKKRESSPISK